MKLAIIHPNASLGGWKFFYLLLKNMLLVDKDLEITVFQKNNYNTSILSYKQELELIGVKFYTYHDTSEKYQYKKKFPIKCISNILNYPAKFAYIKKLKNQNIEEQLNNFDCVFYTWPYSTKIFDTRVPTFFNPQDCILSHYYGSYFGNMTYSNEVWTNYYNTIQKCLTIGTPIVSSHFIAEEIKRLFNYDVKNIIYLSKFNDYLKPTDKEIQEVYCKYGITYKYILCPNNAQLHKNLGQILSALYYIKKKHPQIKLLITGYRQGKFKLQCNTPYYCDYANDSDYDIAVLDEIPDKDFSVLLQNAQIVINASLCEAGNGSGLDAWGCGIPVAMSDIPSFKNQIENVGVRAELFDPRNSHDIARAIIKLLDNPDIAKENAKISLEALNKYDWNAVAKQYLDIFKEEIANEK